SWTAPAKSNATACTKCCSNVWKKRRPTKLRPATRQPPRNLLMTSRPLKNLPKKNPRITSPPATHRKRKRVDDPRGCPPDRARERGAQLGRHNPAAARAVFHQ